MMNILERIHTHTHTIHMFYAWIPILNNVSTEDVIAALSNKNKFYMQMKKKKERKTQHGNEFQNEKDDLCVCSVCEIGKESTHVKLVEINNIHKIPRIVVMFTINKGNEYITLE